MLRKLRALSTQANAPQVDVRAKIKSERITEARPGRSLMG